MTASFLQQKPLDAIDQWLADSAFPGKRGVDPVDSFYCRPFFRL
jgi:hypothetical protein